MRTESKLNWTRGDNIIDVIAHFYAPGAPASSNELSSQPGCIFFRMKGQHGEEK